MLAELARDLMIGFALLMVVLIGLLPLAASGSLMTRAIRQSSRGPPQRAGELSNAAQHHEKALG